MCNFWSNETEQAIGRQSSALANKSVGSESRRSSEQPSLNLRSVQQKEGWELDDLPEVADADVSTANDAVKQFLGDHAAEIARVKDLLDRQQRVNEKDDVQPLADALFEALLGALQAVLDVSSRCLSSRQV